MSDNHLTLAKRFWVDDMPGSSVSGSRLSNLLETFARGNSFECPGQRFLTENGSRRWRNSLPARFLNHGFSSLLQSNRCPGLPLL